MQTKRSMHMDSSVLPMQRWREQPTLVQAACLQRHGQLTEVIALLLPERPTPVGPLRLLPGTGGQ